MLKSIVSLIIILCLSGSAWAQKCIVMPLWSNGPIETNGISEPEEIVNEKRLINISNAAISVQLPSPRKATGAAVIICPGGGYIREAISHEGFQVADWLNKQGIAAIVLKYRLPNGHYNIPLADAQRAIRMVRAHAKEWRIDTSKVAIAGFSAGGHLASTVGTHFDYGKKSTDSVERFSCRPDMMILFYPVISMKLGMSHAGSRENLLGKNPSEELENLFSNELHVKANTPPTIIFLSDNDKSVPPLNSIEFYNALRAKNIPASMHIFPTGGHGWGMHTNIPFYKDWRNLLLEWFRSYQYIK